VAGLSSMTVRIIRISDEPIPDWSDDLLLPAASGGDRGRGPVVTKDISPTAIDSAGKILDPDNGRIIHRMGDVGYLDEQGGCGSADRKSQRVMTPSGTCSPFLRVVSSASASLSLRAGRRLKEWIIILFYASK